MYLDIDECSIIDFTKNKLIVQSHSSNYMVLKCIDSYVINGTHNGEKVTCLEDTTYNWKWIPDIPTCQSKFNLTNIIINMNYYRNSMYLFTNNQYYKSK